MSASVLAAILFAAFLHAAWNAALKSRTDTFMAALAVMGGAALIGALALPFLAPPAPASWPFIAASGLIHIAYYSLLAASYRHADIGHAYPLMRGVAPVLVAVAGVFFTGETLAAAQWSAISLICAGTGRGGRRPARNLDRVRHRDRGIRAARARHAGPAVRRRPGRVGRGGGAHGMSRVRQSELQLIVRLDAHRARIMEAALLDAGDRIGVAHLEARILVRQVR